MSVEKTAGRFPSSLPGWKEDKAKKGQEEDTGKERAKGGHGHRKDTRRTKTKKGGQKRTVARGQRMHNHKKHK